MDELELRIHREVNHERESRGVRPLTADPLLARVARSYSRLMAEHDFFSHHAPVPGHETVVDRVRVAGGRYDGVGENIALHSTDRATAADFVHGWMSSPGHRDNLLTDEWEASGVGVFRAAKGDVFATQLFGIPSAIILHDTRIEARPEVWYVIRVDVHVGAGHALGAFVRNRFITSADADGHGRARLECEIPAEPGQHHVGLGRRPIGSDVGWIGVYDGFVEIGAESGEWRPGAPPNGGCTVHEDTLFRVSGSVLDVRLKGEATTAGIVVVDGARADAFDPGSFETITSFRGGSGAHTVDIGIPEEGQRYRIVRRFHVDADRGELRADELEGVIR